MSIEILVKEKQLLFDIKYVWYKNAGLLVLQNSNLGLIYKK
jgi:hypothetical protein